MGRLHQLQIKEAIHHAIEAGAFLKRPPQKQQMLHRIRRSHTCVECDYVSAAVTASGLKLGGIEASLHKRIAKRQAIKAGRLLDASGNLPWDGVLAKRRDGDVQDAE